MNKVKHGWNLEDKDDLLEFACGIIGNANNGNWDDASEEWRWAAETWTEGYFKINPEPNNYKISQQEPPRSTT